MSGCAYKSSNEFTKANLFWYRVWHQWWIARTIFRKRFWKEPFQDYPQTMYYMPHWKPLKIPIQWLCGRICGHEHSKTDWGYGGGEYADNWCRWCNKRLRVPVSETRFRHPSFNKMRPDKNRKKIVTSFIDLDDYL